MQAKISKRKCSSTRATHTLTCLALLPLASLMTVAAAQQEAANTGGASASILPAEGESTFSAARSPNTAHCRAQIDLEYLQHAAIARADGVLKNQDCAASSGNYEINIRIRNEKGSLQTMTFTESWRRDDDKPVIFSTDYQIGENVDLIYVRTRNVECACADTPEASATSPIAKAADAQSPAEPDLASSGVELAETDAEPMSRRELRRRISAAEALSAFGQEFECRTQIVTGSRMPKRNCATPEEWAAYDAQSEADLEEFLRRRREQTVGQSTASPVFPASLLPE